MKSGNNDDDGLGPKLLEANINFLKIDMTVVQQESAFCFILCNKMMGRTVCRDWDQDARRKL